MKIPIREHVMIFSLLQKILFNLKVEGSTETPHGVVYDVTDTYIIHFKELMQYSLKVPNPNISSKGGIPACHLYQLKKYFNLYQTGIH